MLNLLLNPSYDNNIPLEFSTSFTDTIPRSNHDFQSHSYHSYRIVIPKNEFAIWEDVGCSFEFLDKREVDLFYIIIAFKEK